ncbi:hypothetical protein [Pontibacter amylolyticus]|uniref:DUF2335 domain-containing protein n=1 Tax=Pontibacter amylolyticus TaxID=1424080 RepID=A0ABQ1W104_9BACT|nr:hypothetical protein [Pontibacter amylolyticus]GGG09466.1 hypothetical protein GCM10011323_12530 [Pontibacter amylolyticus]
MIPKLQPGKGIAQSKKLAEEFDRMQQLIDGLNSKAIPEGIAATITQQLEPLNSLDIPDKQCAARLKESRRSILRLVEKQLNLVPQKHHLKLWMALGMSAFGLPFGVVFSLALKNFAFIGLGLPIGIGIGIAVGTKLDEKAKAEGRQLDLE